MPLLVRSAYAFLRGVVMPARWASVARARGYGSLALVDWAGLYGVMPFLEAAEHEGLRPIVGAEVPLRRGAPARGDTDDERGRAGNRRGGDSTHGRTGHPREGDSARGRLFALCEDLSGYRNLSHILSCWHAAAPSPVRDAAGAAAPSPVRDAAGAAVPGPVRDERSGTAPDPAAEGRRRSAWGDAAGDPLAIVAAEAGGLILLSDDAAVLARLRRDLDPAALGALLPWPPCPRGERLKREAARLDIEVVALPQAVLADESERETLRLLEMIRRGELADDQRGRGSCLPDPDEIAVRVETEPVAYRAGRRLVERCRLRRSDLATRAFIFPRIAGPEGGELLRRRCREGLGTRGLAGSARARRRLEEELAVIEQLGFVDYFLATARIVAWAREQRIPTIGRGSGVASLVAYLLFITNVDPLRYGLYFERFLHPLRGDYPDLDIDIAWDRRDEVIRHALAAFGPDRAARIGTHHFFRERGAFREVARALGVGEETITRARRERARQDGDADATIARAARLAARLVGLPRGLGLHPGGIVLADRPISRIVPIERAACGDPVTQFEMHGVEAIGLIKIDLLGNRALGTEDEALRMIRAAGPVACGRAAGPVACGRAAGPVACGRAAGAGAPDAAPDPAAPGRAPVPATPDAAPGRVPVPAAPDMDHIAYDDASTARLLAAGDTLGCLQLESPAMRGLLRQLGARDLKGAIHGLSLVRPGPSCSGMKQAFIRRARGEEVARAIHPALDGVLRETHGVPLYEEDVMCVAAAIGGLTLAEADMLRRAISQAVARAGQAARQDGDLAAAGGAARGGADRAEPGELARLREGFLAAARRHGKLDAAEAAWAVLVRFASYAFCKAHAAGYGVLAYRTAYLKANFPGPFLAALLNNHRGMYPARVYVDDARRRGLSARPPCVQHGDIRWRWELGSPAEPGSRAELGSPAEPGSRAELGILRCGLARVFGLREETLRTILSERGREPFGSLGDFVARVRPNSSELEALLLAGAFDDAFGASRGALVWQTQRLLQGWPPGRRGGTAARVRQMQPALALVRRAPLRALGPGRTLMPGVPSETGLARDPGAASISGLAHDAGTAPDAGPWREISPAHRARLERRFLGISLTVHPVDLWPERGNGPTILAALEAASRGQPSNVALSGIVSATRRHRTQDGEPFFFFTLDDPTGLLECVVRGEAMVRALPRIAVDHYVRAQGALQSSHGAWTLRVQQVRVAGEH